MKNNQVIDRYVTSYGDLIYDLCRSLLPSPTNAQIAFRSIIKKIRSGSRFQKYSTHERGWILRITCNKLLDLCHHHGHLVSAQERIQLDANANLSARLNQFDSFFHRLTPEDQILLLLKDNYKIPYPEIATAMAIPVESLKIRRQQALRTLEEWLWNNS